MQSGQASKSSLQQQQNNKPKLQDKQTQANYQRQSDNICFNMADTMTKIQTYFQDKVIKETISNAVKKTLIRKKIIGDAQFKQQQAIQEGIKFSKGYIDRIETWTADSIASNPAILDYQQNIQQRKQKQMKKLNSIMDLVDKISSKISHKKIQQLQQVYLKQLQTKKIVIKDDEQFIKAQNKLKGLRERIMATKQQVQMNKKYYEE